MTNTNAHVFLGRAQLTVFGYWFRPLNERSRQYGAQSAARLREDSRNASPGVILASVAGPQAQEAVIANTIPRRPRSCQGAPRRCLRCPPILADQTTPQCAIQHMAVIRVDPKTYYAPTGCGLAQAPQTGIGDRSAVICRSHFVAATT
jgi:hypothetical protein